MPSSRPACPTKDELLRFTSGDLSTQRAAKVQAHLRGCPSCTEHIRICDSTLDAYRQHLADTPSDVPRWEGFREALRGEEGAWRRQRAARTRHQWSAAAAIVATIVAAWFWQRQTEVVLNAEEVISRAVVHERERPSSERTPVRVRRIATSVTGVSLETSPIGTADPHTTLQNAHANAASELVSSRGPLAREVARRLGQYGFEWITPLSARHFQRWHQAAEARHDRLLLVNAELFKVFTTAAGAVSQAEILVRQDTYEPVAQRWVFADGFQIELTNLPEEPGAEVSSGAVAAAPESAKPPTVATPLDMEALELDTRSGLYHLGAVIGDDLTIHQVRGRIRVEGVVATREAAEQIAAYARRHTAVDASVRPRTETASRQIEAGSVGLRIWLDQALGDPELRDTFVSRAGQLLEQTGAAAASLESLARRYPPEVVTKLSPKSQHTLVGLAQVQYRDLAARYEALERQLAPLIGTVSRPVMPSALPSGWRSVASSIGTNVQQLTTGVEFVFNEPDFSTPEAAVSAARERLRPALEALGTRIGGRP